MMIGGVREGREWAFYGGRSRLLGLTRWRRGFEAGSS
jgi:hypothetical protein